MKFTIGTVTYNTLFYSKLQIQKIREHTPLESYEILVYDNGSTDGSREWLAEQPDVLLFKSKKPNDRSHGTALDYLVNQTKTPVFCALDADAWPVSNDWLDPMFALNDDVVIAGIDRTWGYTLKKGYVHPSYLFGWTEWLKKFTFAHHWPAEGNKYDTGELVSDGILKAGKQMRLWQPTLVDFDGRFRGKPCDYAGLVWHVWWASRKTTNPGLAGNEFEPDYHDYCVERFRREYDLDF